MFYRYSQWAGAGMISSVLLQRNFMNVVIKISLAVVLLLLVWVMPCSALKLGEGEGINAHPHNLSTLSTALIHSDDGTDQICIFCHTPHSASSKGQLWNRTDNISPIGGGAFPLYGGAVAIKDAASGANYDGTNYPNGASRLCLSCHDGVTAIGEVINSGSSGLSISSLGSLADEALLGPSATTIIDLETSHPISFTYDADVLSHIVGVKPGEYAITALAIEIMDKESRMQCTSCHDPHLDTLVPGAGGYTLPMWRNYTGDDVVDYDNTCNACHIGIPLDALH